MSLIKCPECGTARSGLLPKCPNCNASPKKYPFEKGVINAETYKRWILTFSLLSFFIGSGSCFYYCDNQPRATDWNMHGEEKEWGRIKPWERDKIASGAWCLAGVLLVVFSPLFGRLLAGIAKKTLEIKEKRDEDKSKNPRL